MTRESVKRCQKVSMVRLISPQVISIVSKSINMIQEKKKHYYLVGICGISMSGLAKVLVKQGNVVSGSDLKECRIQNVECRMGHNQKNITKDIDEVIYTSAAENKNAPGYIELAKARELGIKTTKRSKFIGRIMNDKLGVAITGMHGKTTISAMISLILEAAGFDPTCLVGTDVREWKSNAKVGKSKYFVAEACEYDRQMLDFRPKAALITNMEEEHLDTYKGGIKDIRQS
ncbi:MAG: Mur ligase domain-containing protein, partial [Promethearchaeota archaeon]